MKNTADMKATCGGELAKLRQENDDLRHTLRWLAVTFGVAAKEDPAMLAELERAVGTARAGV